MDQVDVIDQSGRNTNFGVRYLLTLDTKLLSSAPYEIRSSKLNTKDKAGKIYEFILKINKSENKYNLNIDLLKNNDHDIKSTIIYGLCDEHGLYVTSMGSINPDPGKSLKSYLPFYLVSYQDLESFCYVYNQLFLNFFIYDHVPVSNIDCIQKLASNASKIPEPHDCLYLKDFRNLLESSNLSDFKIVTNDKEFNVHKNILSARSTLFARKFQTDNQEKSVDDDRMAIEKETRVVEEMMNYKICNRNVHLI